MFKDKLINAMEIYGYNQATVAALTGKSKATVSNWVSGKQIPHKEEQADIASCLKLYRNYFDESDPDPITNGIRRMTVTEAAKLLHTRESTVAYGLQQGVFPWGYGIKTADGWTYIINADKFEKVEGIKV